MELHVDEEADDVDEDADCVEHLVQREQIVHRVELLDYVQDARIRFDVVGHLGQHPTRRPRAKHHPHDDIHKVHQLAHQVQEVDTVGEERRAPL